MTCFFRTCPNNLNRSFAPGFVKWNGPRNVEDVEELFESVKALEAHR